MNFTKPDAEPAPHLQHEPDAAPTKLGVAMKPQQPPPEPAPPQHVPMEPKEPPFKQAQPDVKPPQHAQGDDKQPTAVIDTQVATPVRNTSKAGFFTPLASGEKALDIPSIDDCAAEKPKVGTIRISASAVESRLRRVFTPNVAGQYKVSSEIVNLWKGGKKGRKSLEQIFQTCGFCVDRVSNQTGCALFRAC